MTITYVLVSEGSDDRMLHAPIDWLLSLHCRVPFSGVWADPASLSDRSRVVRTRLSEVRKYYPCDIAFVHRDTDNSTIVHRRTEITSAVTASGFVAPVVCVIPVRMTEAWFLFDQLAIRKAAGNPASRVDLRLPNQQTVQRRADPKQIMEQSLVRASELAGRKLSQFQSELSWRKSLVSTYIDDFSPLRVHQSFVSFENELVEALQVNGWT